MIKCGICENPCTTMYCSRVMPELSKYDEGHEATEDTEGWGEASRSLPSAVVTTLRTCTTLRKCTTEVAMAL